MVTRLKEQASQNLKSSQASGDGFRTVHGKTALRRREERMNNVSGVRLLRLDPGISEKNERVRNFLKAMCFANPEWIPTSVSFLPATWQRHGERLAKVLEAHPDLFPGYKPSGCYTPSLPRRMQKGRWRDAWGTLWDNVAEGLDSIPVEEGAPLRDWAAFEDYQAPEALATDDWGEPIDWKAMREHFARVKEQGGLAVGAIAHGFMYMRLFYLRGFTNLMIDIGTRDPRLDRLIDMVASRNERLVKELLAAGAEMISGGDDLGMQTSLPMRPDDWRRYIKPAYARIFADCREGGVPVYLHSDGHIFEIIPDLVDCGITIINPQIRANGLEGLVKYAKGRVAIHIDLDRQLFPFATPERIKAHVREVFEALYKPEGGLMLHAECGPDIPLENIEAICEALEEVGGGPWM